MEGFAKVKPNWDYWGLINTEEEYVLEPFFKTIFEWKNGIARLERKPTKIDVGGRWTNHLNGEYGFINDEGILITDFSYGYANDFSNGLAAVCRKKKWGFINERGEVRINHEFEDIGYFDNESCIVKQNNKWGLIDKQGNFIINNKFEGLSAFSFGLAIAEVKNALSGTMSKFVIDKAGNKIVDLPKEWTWFKLVSGNLILIGTKSNFPGERTYGFMNLQGEITSNPQFYTNSDSGFSTGTFRDGMLVVANKERKIGFVNEQGRLTVPLIYDGVYVCEQGIAKVKKGDQDYCINKEGDIVECVEFSNEVGKNREQDRPFDQVLPFSEGLAVASRNDMWGVINENNEIIIDFKFKPNRHLRTKGDRGLYLNSFQYSCGLISICEERPDNIYCGYMDHRGNVAIDLKFRVAEQFHKV